MAVAAHRERETSQKVDFRWRKREMEGDGGGGSVYNFLKEGRIKIKVGH